MVYDCSAKKNAQVPSLNDCHEVGPALQPRLVDIMIRNRMKRHCIVGDVKKAFIQIRVKEEDRDAQRILWYDNLEERNIIEYRLTRVIFGAGPSPYILGATLQKHVSQYKDVRIYLLILIGRYYREPFLSYEKQVALIEIITTRRRISPKIVGPFSTIVS